MKSHEHEPMQLVTPQSHFGPRSFIVCIVILNLIVILAIDMYIPALPSMLAEFGVTESFLNLTMFVFFLFIAVGIMLAGPLSDKYGRKPVIIAGYVIFTAGSLACQVSPSVGLLIIGRATQAFGFGFIQVAVSAITSDSYRGYSLKLAMTIIQSATLIGPAVAPFIGTFIIAHFDWRAVFVVLTVCGIACTLLAFLTDESMQPEARQRKGVVATLAASIPQGRQLLSDRNFSGILAIFGLIGMPVAAFLAVISYIYFGFFDATYMEYNLGYAAVSVMSVLAPFVYIRLSRGGTTHGIITFSILLAAFTGVSLLIFGKVNIALFTLLYLPYTLAEGIIRPMAYVVLLEQEERLVGTASSLTNLIYWILFAMSTVIATLPWPDFIIAIGAITTAIAAACAVILHLAVKD